MECIQKNYGTNMGANTLKNIFDEFDHESNYVNHSELNSGHINDTFIIETDGSKNYILQKINHNIFKDIPGLVNNKALTSSHLKSKYPKLSEEELSKKVLSFVKVKNGNLYYYKNGNDFWNGF